MSTLSEENLRVTIQQLRPRMRHVLDGDAACFAGVNAGQSWKDDPIFLQHLGIELDALRGAIEQRVQELTPHEPIELASKEN